MPFRAIALLIDSFVAKVTKADLEKGRYLLQEGRFLALKKSVLCINSLATKREDFTPLDDELQDQLQL